MPKTRMIYGFHAVLARLKQNPNSIKELFLDEKRAQKTHDSRVKTALDYAASAKITPKIIDFKTLKNIENLRHQGILAEIEASQKALTLWDILDSADFFTHTDSEKPLIFLVLDGVTDPRNLGACLRAADGAGALAVIAAKDRAAPLNEIAMKTASGAAESVPYIVVTNLATALQDMQEAGVSVIGLSDSAADNLYETKLPHKIAFVLGSEGKGLRQRTQKSCDLLLKIPMYGSVESLNVSTAAALCLFESRRQFPTQNPR